MKLSSCIVLRPFCFLIILMLVVLSLASLLIPLWTVHVARIEEEVKSIPHDTNREASSRIRRTSALFSPTNASTINLARILSSSLGATNLDHFSVIESKVAPRLFQSLSTIPYVSQVSYIGLDGLFFAYYYTGEKQLYALYSNATFSSTKYTWYTRAANPDTGRPYGEVIKSPPFALVNSSWFQESLNASYASVGTSWGPSRDVLLLSTVRMGEKKGAVSLGFSMKFIVDLLLSEVAFYRGGLYLATVDGNVLTQGIPNARVVLAGNRASCQSDNVSVLSIWGRKYFVACSSLEIAGLKTVYVLATPKNELLSLVHKNIRLAFVMLVLMIGVVVITICGFVYRTVEAAKREMHLCSSLINQMEATRQSERKSMNKSLAFANASHDIRASLAGITGLVEMCRDEVTENDHLHSNLQQMEVCTRDLLGILNSILDTSKIESGKMQLEEEEFDIERLLEDVVDLFHPVGSKKGVDVILDPFDGSVIKTCWVKGDRGKLKQILSNLLSNAVKFTSEGHVVVRAWARKPSLGDASNRRNSVSCVFSWLFKNDKACNESEASNQQYSNRVEFVFEVVGTGKGIPKEKQNSVFENYVQVNETAPGHEGTGLGLGIVQSLVRLMGGEIGIVDKEFGERGTCFRFNVLFSTSDISDSRALDMEVNSDSCRNLWPMIRIQSPKTEGSQVLLFMHSSERSKLLQSFMQRLGIKVHVVKQHELLSPTLKKIKRRLNLSNLSSSRNSRSTSSTLSKEVPLSSMDGTDGIILSSQKRHNNVLVVIDTQAGPFREVSRAVVEFRRGLSDNCYSRVVWLDKPNGGSSTFQGLDEGKLPPSDLVISKPFHGSRLHHVISLLPEFGGRHPRGEESQNVEKVGNSIRSCVGENSSVSRKGKFEILGGPNSQRPLMGKKVLIADDDSIGRNIAARVVSQLGADVYSCENGDKAWSLVCKKLEDGTEVAGGSKDISVPFDCILMDCEMPIMDGIETTARIRDAEKLYGVRIPIMALTAHSRGEEIDKMIQAGVDGYVTKPLNREKFLKAISEL